jgi:hypothetical protein
MQFRETLWFKKPPIEAEAAPSDDKPTDTLRPVQDRYSDFEAPVTRVDSQTYGLHTGRTEALPRLKPVTAGPQVSEHVLAAEFRRMRAWYGLAAACVLAATMLAIFVAA